MADKLEIFTKGTRAWFKDEEEGYITATLVTKEVNDKNVKLVFKIDSNGKEVVYEQALKELEKSNYDDLPPLKNPPRLVIDFKTGRS